MNSYSNKKVWQITYPILLSLLMENMIGLTDTAFLGRVGEVELGASALAGVYYMAIFMLAFGFSIGTQILIARRNGEGRFKSIGLLFQQGTLFLLALATAMFFASRYFSPTILQQFINSEAVYEATVQYTDWRVYGFFFAFVSLMFRAFLVGTTNTRILTLNSVIMVGTNIVLNYALIFGRLGMPQLGIAGAAIASSVAELVSMIFFIVYCRFKIDRKKYGLFRYAGFKPRLLGHMLNVSVWTMIQAFVAVSIWFLFFIAIEHLGETSLAISNIVRSVSALLFVIASSFASAASSLVGNLMGEGRQNEVIPLCRRIVRMCYTLILPLMLLMALFPSVVLRIYTDDAALIASSVDSLWIMLSSYLIAVPGIILFNAISGTGNTRSALVMDLIALGVYMLYIGYIALYRHADVAVCWTAEHIYAVVLLAISVWYLRRGEWKTKQI